MRTYKKLGVMASLACLAGLLTGCEYGKMLRPATLKQLNPDVVRMVNQLQSVDNPNEDIVARLFVHGGMQYAKEGPDGIYRGNIRVPNGQFIWKPAIISMEQGGELELTFHNEDKISHHAAYLPNNGSQVLLSFAPGESGTARIKLDNPGLYWFGCPVANHAGRGMLGLVLVKGEVPKEAKLDRPKQERP